MLRRYKKIIHLITKNLKRLILMIQPLIKIEIIATVTVIIVASFSKRHPSVTLNRKDEKMITKVIFIKNYLFKT